MYDMIDNSFYDELRVGSFGPKIIQLLGYKIVIGRNDSSFKYEKPAHEVEISEFYIGKYPVTIKEYNRYCSDTKSYMIPGYEYNPITNVSWEDANDYCDWLSDQTNKHYRLPTEAEWECACGASNPFNFWFGNKAKKLSEYAWYVAEENLDEPQPHPVGQKRPNPWGLYDMYGNVFEWVGDWWDSDYYQVSPNKDPQGPEDGLSKVIRGGCVMSLDFECTTQHRAFWDKNKISNYIGFRVARDKDKI